MLICLLAAGTRGDTQPFIALGVALKEAGYQIRLAAAENFEALVTDYGLEFYPIQGNVEHFATNPELKASLAADNPLKTLRSFKTLRDYAYEMQKDYYAACQGSDAIIYHPGVTIGYFAAQKLKIPSILASPFPFTPTKDYPALIFYQFRLGKWANKLSHKLFEQVLWQTSSQPINRFWKERFGSLPQEFGKPYQKQHSQSRPTLISGSEHVFPRGSDWPDHVYNTGYWFLEKAQDWQASKELQDFLDKGPAPLYVGFGSIGNPETAEATTRLVIDALAQTGQRGVLATGWQGLQKVSLLPDHIFMLESAPHSWLFPRMAAVIHHGGAGTTAAGLRAGIPSIIIPHGLDQFAWGQRIYELGVGPKPIPKKKLSVPALAAAIESALAEKTRERALELGKKMESEKGLETATRIIIDALQSSTAGQNTLPLETESRHAY
ncbi:MAG: glycosyltransferase family 1 protein [Trueperaceae bacterium]|nr:glycosyltransferase family 1 protein [Trueperaceae bacterium]